MKKKLLFYSMFLLYFLHCAFKANSNAFLPENVNYNTIYKKVLNKQKREALKRKEQEARLLLQKNEKAQFASKTFLEKITFIGSRYIVGSPGRFRDYGNR